MPMPRRRSPFLSLAAPFVLAGAVLVGGPGAPLPLEAQEEARAELTGRVVREGEPVTPAMVVLHHVTPASAGEIDSVRVDAGGGFTFDLPSVPDPGGRSEVYFASVRHQGIMYFGRAIHQAVDLDSAYVIEVSDTTTAGPGGAALPISMRHVILEEIEDGWQVTELFQVLNEGNRTIVAPEDGATWIYPLPDGATRIETGGDDVPDGEAVVSQGRYRVTAAIPPGERQFLVRYRMPSVEFTLPAPGRTQQMELLVREPAPPLSIEGLVAAEAVEMEPGTSFRRYVATGLAGADIVIGPGDDGRPAFSVRWLAVVLGLLLAVAGIWAVMRPRGTLATAAATPGAARGGGGAPGGPTGGAPSPRTPEELRRALLVEVARIDETLEGGEASEREIRTLRQRRADLVERLQALA